VLIGTPIYSAPGDGDSKIVGLRVGTIRQQDQLILSDQYGVRAWRPWLQHLARMDPKGGLAEC